MLGAELGFAGAVFAAGAFLRLGIVLAAADPGYLVGMQPGDGALRFFVIRMIFFDPFPAAHRLIELTDIRQSACASPIDFDVARIGRALLSKT